jgi:hypothetical protein
MGFTKKQHTTKRLPGIFEQPLSRFSPARFPFVRKTQGLQKKHFQSNLFIVVVSQILDY